MTNLALLPSKEDRIRIPAIYYANIKKPKELPAMVDTGAYRSFLGIDSLKRLGRELKIERISHAINNNGLIPIYGITTG